VNKLEGKGEKHTLILTEKDWTRAISDSFKPKQAETEFEFNTF